MNEKGGEEEGSHGALIFRVPQGTAGRAQTLNRESSFLRPSQGFVMLMLCPLALCKDPSSLSSCTSKGILEETDANYLSMNPTISRTLHQAAGAVG